MLCQVPGVKHYFKLGDMLDGNVRDHTSRLGQWFSIPEIRPNAGCLEDPYICFVDRSETVFNSGSCGTVV